MLSARSALAVSLSMKLELKSDGTMPSQGLSRMRSTLGVDWPLMPSLLLVTTFSTLASENSALEAELIRNNLRLQVTRHEWCYRDPFVPNVILKCMAHSPLDILRLRPFPNQSIPSAGSALGRSRYQHNVALLLERRDDLIECLCIHLHPLEQDTVWQRSIRSRL